METKYGRCPICKVEITGWGIDDLNKNIKFHIENEHPKKKVLSVESETATVEESEEINQGFDVDLEGMTRNELLEFAEELGFRDEIGSRWRKTRIKKFIYDALNQVV